MTTREAELRYLQIHLNECQGRPLTVFNPNNLPEDDLPVIMGLNNSKSGGSPGFMRAIAVAQDGTVLGEHLCSHEGYMPHDLGLIEGSRPDRHENSYQKHYPNGYRMVWIPTDERDNSKLLQRAFELNLTKEATND
jgi:hypothetical protein